MGEIKGVGRKNGGKPGMYILEMRIEEEKVNVLKRKKALKGRQERIEEDLTWNERRRKWVMNQRAWGERMKGNRAWVEDRIWINGNIRIWDDEEEELSEVRRERPRLRREEERGGREKGGDSGVSGFPQ